jgi:hypothetical protein
VFYFPAQHFHAAAFQGFDVTAHEPDKFFPLFRPDGSGTGGGLKIAAFGNGASYQIYEAAGFFDQFSGRKPVAFVKDKVCYFPEFEFPHAGKKQKPSGISHDERRSGPEAFDLPACRGRTDKEAGIDRPGAAGERQ